MGRFRTLGFLRQQQWKADRRMVYGTPEILGEQRIRRILLPEPRRVRRIEVPVPRRIVRVTRILWIARLRWTLVRPRRPPLMLAMGKG